jgi:hypothetical protein
MVAGLKVSLFIYAGVMRTEFYSVETQVHL